jgi:hypothetical protein
MPSEELGASAARKYDMEAWMPGRGKWGEASRLESLLLCSALHEACLTIVDLLDIQLYRLPVSPTAYPLPSIRCGRVRVRGFHQHHTDAIRHATIRAHSEWHGCGGPAAARGATGERGEAGRAGSSRGHRSARGVEEVLGRRGRGWSRQKQGGDQVGLAGVQE